ncbi:hypothetical protein L916_20574 [Phytophthora nicotianae]|uniref:Uncharacterized protein n=1 Tax=Phytophthora nicotianae TaxID=4792 RepID=W2HUH2_PHYNI|nr:hypothetical protein L916_20574 [Phytophthora nicotianae]
MTSPYDTRHETTAVDINADAGFVYNESESVTRNARRFQYYAGMCNYYHVLGCQYNVFIENLGGDPFWVYTMFYNDVQPPPGATNEDMQLLSDVTYKYLDRRYVAVQSVDAITANELRSKPSVVYNRQSKRQIQIKLNYLVEFKELKDGLRWSIQRQPITVTMYQASDSVD